MARITNFVANPNPPASESDVPAEYTIGGNSFVLASKREGGGPKWTQVFELNRTQATELHRLLGEFLGTQDV